MTDPTIYFADISDPDTEEPNFCDVVRANDYNNLKADRDQQYDMKVKAREQRDKVTLQLKQVQAEVTAQAEAWLLLSERTLELECQRDDLAVQVRELQAEASARAVSLGEAFTVSHQLGRTDADSERLMRELEVIIIGHPSQLPPSNRIFLEPPYQRDVLDCFPRLTATTKAQRADPHQNAGRTRGEKAWLKRKGH